MIGTTAALIGMAAASAGSKVVSSAIEGHASNKAAQTQIDATKTVQAKQDQLWKDYNTQAAPYLKSGQQSVNLLGSLMLPAGTPGSYRPAAAPPQRPDMRMGGPMQNPWGRGAMSPRPPMPPGPPQNAQSPGGAGPFGYTDNSLVSPWGRQFVPPGAAQ